MSRQAQQEIVEIGRRIYQKGYISATEGNLSIRLDEDRILATPSGLCKGDLTPDDLVTIDTMGNHLAGNRKASSEILMHLEVYRQRPDVRAVVHAHPPLCIALMLAGKGLDEPILAESIIILGKIPIAPYARPSTPEVPASIRELVHRSDCLLLDHHGSLTVGSSLQDACHKLETMEHTAKSYLAALQLGIVRTLSRDEIDELNFLRENVYGIKSRIIPF